MSLSPSPPGTHRIRYRLDPSRRTYYFRMEVRKKPNHAPKTYWLQFQAINSSNALGQALRLFKRNFEIDLIELDKTEYQQWRQHKLPTIPLVLTH